MIDGVHLDFGDGWFLIRANATNKRVHVTAQAQDADTTNRYLQQATDIVWSVRESA